MPIATTSGAIIPPNAKVLYWRNDGTFDLIEENSIFLYFFSFSVTFILGIWSRNFIFSLVPVDFYILIDFSNWHFYCSNLHWLEPLVTSWKNNLCQKLFWPFTAPARINCSSKLKMFANSLQIPCLEPRTFKVVFKF